MNGGRYQTELEVALEAVRLASRICRRVQAGIEPGRIEKDDSSPVTVADYASQAAVCRALLGQFPHDPIIGEEESGTLQRAENRPFLERVLSELNHAGIGAAEGDACRWIDAGCAKEYSPRFWTLDPIDGTKGFLRNEQYAVSLALVIEGQIELGVLGCPNLPAGGDTSGSLLYAVRGKGSWSLPLDGGGSPRAVHCNQSADAASARFCESVESAHTAHNIASRVVASLGITREPLRMDSQAKYAVVARGDADIYLRLPVKFGYKEKVWDHAGGVLIVEEAGGKVSDVEGRPLEFQHGDRLMVNRGVVASTAPLHGRVIDALRDIYAQLPPPSTFADPNTPVQRPS